MLLPLIKLRHWHWLLGEKVKPLTIIGGIALVEFFGSRIGLQGYNVTNHADLY